MNSLKNLLFLIFALNFSFAQMSSETLVGKLPGELIVDNTGQANYSLPIDIPVGFSGMEPSLSLEYSSSGGSGIMGVGWSLSGLEQIARSSRNYAFDQIVDGIDYDNNDQLSYEGERLKLVGGSGHLEDGSVYRTYVDDFSRITAKGSSNGPTHFFVETKDGLVKTFGLNDNSSHILSNRIDVDNARVAWLLDKVQDINGNYIDYKYKYDVETNEILIDSIHYTGNDSSGISAHNKIEFVFDQHTKVRSRYFLGAKLQIKNRLSKILCYSNSALVWGYDFEYEDSPVTQNSRLVSVTKTFSAEDRDLLLPPTYFIWRDIDLDTKWQDVTSSYKMSDMTQNEVDRGVRFVDLNADGLTDYVRNFRNSSVEAKINNGSGWEDAPTEYLPPEIVGTIGGYDRGVRFMDLNGDGLTDMLKYHNGGQSSAWLNSGLGWEANDDYILSHPITGDSDGDDWGSRFVDLNGDGLVDVLWNRNSSQIGAALNTGSGWEDASAGYYPPCEFVDSNGNDMGARLIDVNGDDLVDLVWNFNGSQKGARLNTGDGWEPTDVPGYTPQQPLAGSQGTDLGTRFTDINGDGLVDIIRVYKSSSTTRRAYLNTGISWIREDSYAPNCWPFAFGGRRQGVDLVDLNGDGINDIVEYTYDHSNPKAYINENGTWVRDDRFNRKIATAADYGLDGIFETRAQSVDLDGDGILDQIGFHNLNPDILWGEGAYLNKQSKPDLLERVTDGFGATTSIQYAPITNDTIYTKEVDSAQLDVDFPIAEFSSAMWVVHQVSMDTGIENVAGQTVFHNTSYRYAGARLHQQGLGFLGFRTFISKDEQTGLIKAEILEQAPFFAGMKLGTKNYAPNGQLLSYTSNSISAKMLNPYTVFEDGVEVTKYRTIYPYYDTIDTWTAEYMPNSNENHYWDMTDAELETFFFTNAHTHNAIENDLDTYGNKISISMDYGDGFTHETTNIYYNYTAEPTFDNNGNRTAGKWFLGLLNTSTSTYVAPDTTSQSETVVRNSKFTYNTNYQLYEEIVEPGNSRSVTTRYNRDTEGRIISTIIDPSDDTAIETEKFAVLDPSKRFYTETFNAFNHKEIRLYNPTRGWIDSQTEPNGRETEFNYDALGRLIREDRPDATWTTTQHVFDDSQVVQNLVDGSSIQSKYRVTVEGLVAPPITTWYDRLGRLIRTCTVGFDEKKIYQDTLYNDQGQVEHISENYYEENTPEYWTSTTFDALTRPDEITAPDGTKAKTLYNGREIVSISNYTGFEVPSIDGTSIDGLNFPANDYSQNQTTKSYQNSKGDAQKVTSYIRDARGNRELTIDYSYNGFGDLLETKTTSPLDGTRVISMGYDVFGNKVSMDDPDMGLWYYNYNALGELTEQYDAAGNATVTKYDDLGRTAIRSYYTGVSISSGDGTAGDYLTGTLKTTHNWYYDGDDEFHELGKLHLEKSSDGFKRAYYYDDLGRMFLTLSKIEGRWFYEQTDYDNYSRPIRLTHYWRPPEMDDRLYDHYYAWYSYSQETIYNKRSFVTEVRDANGQKWWSDPTYNEHGQITSYLTGNIIEKNTDFDPATHRPERIYLTSDPGDRTLLDYGYDFDRLGNLTQRSDNILNITETMTFDMLNRLTGTTVDTNTTTVTYEDFGNITSRSSTTDLGQIGAYNYFAGTNRVQTAGDRTLSYNANGSIAGVTISNNDPLSFNEGEITWTAFNKPYSLKSGHKRSIFDYDVSDARVTQTRQEWNAGNGTWLNKTRKTYIGRLFEQEQIFQSSKWDITYTRIYISTPSGVIGSWVSNTAETNPTKTLFYRDHLGSVIAESELASSSFEQISQRFSYDVWGNIRDASNWSSETTSKPERIATDHGYTGHEILEELGLIHMNGRIYDPLLGRFLSADPFIQAPANLQNYNRYSYVLNNPVSLTDPSGFNWWNPSSWINGIANALSSSEFFSTIKSFLSNEGSILWVGNLKNADQTSSNVAKQNISQVNSQTTLQNNSQINTQGMANASPGIDRSEPSSSEAEVESNGGFWSDAKSFGKGFFWTGPKNMVVGTYTAVRHPIQTVQGIGSFATAALDDPVGTGKAIVDSVVTSVSDPEGAGAALFDVGTSLLAVTKVGKISKLDNFATNKVDNVVTGVCFVAGTLVATSTGFAEIQDLEVGEQVWSYNIETEQWELNEVVETFVHEYKDDVVTIKVGDATIEATGNHPFWVVEGSEITTRPAAVDVPLSEREQSRGGRWIEARSLKTGDVLLLQNGEHQEVVELSSHFQELLVYNIEVSNNHTYAVSKISVLVHNKAAERVINFGSGVKSGAATFHSQIKPSILSKAGKFSGKVGKNPDIKVVWGKINLQGVGPFKGKTFKTDLNASDFFGQ